MDDQIKLLYNLVHRCQYSSAIKQANNMLNRMKNKTKNREQCLEELFIVTGLRGISYLKMGSYAKGEEDINNIMEIRPLNEDIITILWHYYIINTSIFNMNTDKLKSIADYFQDGLALGILSEQFGIDLLSLYCYLNEFNTFKSLCNKLYKKHEKKPYYLALNVLISFLVLQKQIKEGANFDSEASLLSLLVNKFLKTVEESSLGICEEKNNSNQLFERRIIAIMNLIKLFVLRKTTKFDLYYSTYIELFSNSKNFDYYSNLMPVNCKLLKNLAVLEEHEHTILMGQNKLKTHYDAFFKLVKDETKSGNPDWDNLRLIKHFVIKLFKEVIDVLYNEQDIFICNSTDILIQNSHSSQLTNSSSFQTQSTMSSVYSCKTSENNNIHESGMETIYLDSIFGVINILNDKCEIYDDNKEAVYNVFLDNKKGRILRIELFSQVLTVLNNRFVSEKELAVLYSRNNNCDSLVKNLIENLLCYVNEEIISMISSEHEKNAIIDLKALLFSYFNINIRNNKYENNVIYTIYDDISYLLNNYVLEVRPTNWIYYTNRLQILIIYNQLRSNSSVETLKEHNFDLNQILQIFKNATLEKSSDNCSDFVYFLVSLSIYCLCTPFGSENESFNAESVFLFILIYINNNIPGTKDEGNNYFLYNIISELCPLLGLYSLSHFIRNSVLNIKRSQYATLYTYSNFVEMLSYPYFSTLNCGKPTVNGKTTLKDKINSDFRHDGNNIKALLDSHMTIYSEVRETYIESLREDTYSVLNLLECSKINKDYSDCSKILIVFGITNINNIFSLLLNKNEDYRSQINIFKHIFEEFIHINSCNILENYKNEAVKQDFSPALGYYIPIYDIDFKFNEAKNELVPSSIFEYCEYLSFEKYILSNDGKKINNKLAEFTNCLPKLKYKLIQRLKLWYSALILFSDITAVTDSSDGNSRTINTQNKLLDIIESHKNTIFSDKYSNCLLDQFDFELYNEITVPILKLFFEIVYSNTLFSSGNWQSVIKNNINSLVILIDGKLSELVDTYLIKEFNISSDKLSYIELENQFEKITSLIFGPILLILLIKDWLSTNLSKKIISNSNKNIVNSILKLVQVIHDNYSTHDFNGTVEIRALNDLFDYIDCSDVHDCSSEFIIDIQTLLKSQKISAENISNTLMFIINSIRNI
ncbi:hypothetical protein RS030_91517 [Cryptosporidium xiaoi]|uniref:Uncharacterized protein n=1 Tax=Cryptosporidium xiaoi TaxID=659607 RepID=A0AAV9XSK1_9CRYT